MAAVTKNRTYGKTSFIVRTTVIKILGFDWINVRGKQKTYNPEKLPT
jgi:hypothetical protein